VGIAVEGLLMEEESPPTPLDKGGEEAARASLTMAAPLDKGGEEAARASLTMAAPLDKGGEESPQPPFIRGEKRAPNI
jgi:hypothetical protein